MAGARDRYHKSEKEERADDVRRAWMRRELQHYFALITTYHACYDAYANVPGTMSNAILQAFVATDPRNINAPDWQRHRVPRVPQYAELRRQAWRALSGDYQRALRGTTPTERGA
jgi:hypothetical protein